MRVLYNHLLTESGFDLWTESGEPLNLQIIGYAGDVVVHGRPGAVDAAGRAVLRGTGAVTGQAGTVVGTGRAEAATEPVKPVYPPSTTLVIPAQPAIRGRASVVGQAGQAAGQGHLTLVGHARAAGEPVRVEGQGHATLAGNAKAGPWNHGYAKAGGQRAVPGKATVGPLNHGYVKATGSVTLSGTAKVSAHNHGYVKATGYDEDELAIVLLLAA